MQLDEQLTALLAQDVEADQAAGREHGAQK